MSARPFLVSVPLLLAVAVFVPNAAAQQAATPDQRCTGTLCDLFYGAEGGAQPPAAPGQPVAVPAKPAAVPIPRVAVQGGGVIGMMSGAPQERCTGTLCDVFYGGPPPEKPEPQPSALAPATAPRSILAPATPPDSDDVPVARRGRDVVETEEREDKPRCVAPASDPWRCYR